MKNRFIVAGDFGGGGNRKEVSVATLEIFLVMEMFCLLTVPKSQHPGCDIVVWFHKMKPLKETEQRLHGISMYYL